MPKRTLDVTDTFSSPSEPIVPITVTSQLASFIDDTAYETAKGSAGTVGDIYLNTTTSRIRYHNGTAFVDQENELNNSIGADPVAGDDDTQGYSIGSVWVNTTSDDIFIAADVSTGAAVWQQVNGGGGGGEVNTASNQGAGSQVFKQKTVADLEFRTLAEGSNITLTQNADTIEIASSPGVANIEKVVLLDVKTSGTNGGSAALGIQTRDINTIVADGVTSTDVGGGASDSFVSIASNQFDLDAGTYQFRGSCPALVTGQHKANIRNVTDATDPAELMGTSEFSENAAGTGNDVTRSHINGSIVIAGTKTFEIRHEVAVAAATSGLGLASGFTSKSEIYTYLEITKLA